MTNIPRQIQAGDTLEFIEAFSEYPATDGWNIHVLLIGPQMIDLISIPSGDQHKFSKTADETKDWSPGFYSVQAYAKKAESEITLYRTQLDILENLRLVKPNENTDSRSHVRKVFESLKAIIEQRSTKGYENITIAGRTVTQMNMEELIQAYHHYERLVQQEEKADKIKRGMNAGGLILTRFDPVR